MNTANTTTAGAIAPHHKVLYNHFITDDQPGTILRDFDTLLRIIREAQPLPVTSSGNLPPMKMLPAINARLTHPLRLDLKRPQHKSFPNILGLFLLLRATGLTLLDGSGKMVRLVIDADVQQSWQALNPTERYFTLLEAALLWAEPSIIGEQSGGRWYHPLYRWSDLLQRIPDTGLEKVTVWNKVWRRIAISGDLALDRLSDGILKAFEFDDPSHLYRFIYFDRFGIERHVDHPELYEHRDEEDLPPLTNAVRIRDVPLRLGAGMIFYFDFGDQWEFEVLLDAIQPPDAKLTRPKILETHGTAPAQYGSHFSEIDH